MVILQGLSSSQVSCWFPRIFSCLEAVLAHAVKGFTHFGVTVTSTSFDLVINDFVDDEVLRVWFVRVLVFLITVMRKCFVIVLNHLIHEKFCGIGLRLFVRGLFGWFRFRGPIEVWLVHLFVCRVSKVVLRWFEDIFKLFRCPRFRHQDDSGMLNSFN